MLRYSLSGLRLKNSAAVKVWMLRNTVNKAKQSFPAVCVYVKWHKSIFGLAAVKYRMSPEQVCALQSKEP